MAVKVHIFSRHKPHEFGVERLKLLKRIHGKDVVIEFDHETRFSGELDQKTEDCVSYFSKKIQEKYICYVVLPQYLKNALLENMIPFGVIEQPVKVKRGEKIQIVHFTPKTSSGPETKNVKASKILHKKKESGGYVNTAGKKKATSNRR